VAIARALAGEPRLLLLDEPFAALDALTRERLQEELRALAVRSGMTVVFVTHSAEEAVLLGSRVLVMAAGPGRIVAELAVDLPREPDTDAAALRGTADFARLRGELAEAVRRSPEE
jgi:taurine transport system ATP-binding protein